MPKTPIKPQTTYRNGIDVTTLPPDKIKPLTHRQIIGKQEKILAEKNLAKGTPPTPDSESTEPPMDTDPPTEE